MSLRSWGNVYITAVVAAGLGVIALSFQSLYVDPIGYQWFILAFLTLISGSATVKLPSVPATISISETFVFTSVLLFGQQAGTLTVALDGLVISFWLARKQPRFAQILFNVAAPSLSIWLAASAFYAAAGVEPLIRQPSDITDLVLPLFLFTVLYFLLNSGFIALAISFESRLSPYTIWRKNFMWLSLNYFGGASVAALLVVYTRDIDLTYLGVIVPLLLILYFTFHTSMARVEDANRHLAQMNSLYLSTIETLAMAIDAKDQITHGHIRRVQSYAVALARASGVKDEEQLKAIEAASLLHDMGKLAVPEYILNKPGKLTPAEFEKMKKHASAGADILSSIDFPCPVVPIVRHHHENWDGTGYPDGLAGSDIPLAARILSVVDCFDALTSDRPYRPRMTDKDALRILADRSGNMYDPAVVTTSARLYPTLTQDRGIGPSREQVFTAVTASNNPPETKPVAAATLDDISASTEEMLSLYDLARSLGGQVTLSDACEIIARHLTRMLPAVLCIFYVYDEDTDRLRVGHASGEHAAAVGNIRVKLGQQLSGWVAANRRTITNSDPLLDLGDLSRTFEPRLRSCLSTPLVVDEELTGVLTLFAHAKNAFTEDHSRIIEVVGRQVSGTMRRAQDADKTREATLKDSETGLPNAEHLRQFFESIPEQKDSKETALALILLAIDGMQPSVGSAEKVPKLSLLIHIVRRNLRGADLLFRYDEHELVALLSQTSVDTARQVASRIEAAVRLNDDSALPKVRVSLACRPQDGVRLSELIKTARTQMSQLRSIDNTNDLPSESIH